MMDVANLGLTRGEAKAVAKDTMFRKSLASLSLLSLSCSSTVELSSATHLTPSEDPTVLGSIDQKVQALAVDDQRLYWMGTDGEAAYGRTVSLHSCLKDHCVDSLVTYVASGMNEPAGFGVQRGQVYWFQEDTSGENTTWKLLACDRAGCGPQPRAVGFETGTGPTVSAYGRDALYSYSEWDNQLWRVPLSGDTAPSLLARVPRQCTSLTVRGDYVYWLSPSYAWTLDFSRIQRTRSDGSSPVETIADDVEIVTDLFAEYNSGAIEADASYVYWSQGRLRGSIARCPLTGCVGAPEVFAGPIRSPTTLLLAGSHLYWQHSTSSSGDAVSRCAFADCKLTAPLAQGVDALNALAVDEHYLYTATTTQELSPEAVWTNPTAQIRRIPMPRGSAE